MGGLVGSSSIACISAVVPTPDPSCHLGDSSYHDPDAVQSSKAYARSTLSVELLHGLVGLVGHSGEPVTVPIKMGLDTTTP